MAESGKQKTENREEPDVVRISVRSLVEFILRSGDIDDRTGGMPDREAMHIGSRLHRKIQGSQGAEYAAEVPLFRETPCDDFVIRVEGRADGIVAAAEGKPAMIDEIKGIARPVDSLEEPVGVHLAQAKCYACFYAGDHGLDRILVRMTYINLETEEIRYFREAYSREELEDWFGGILEEYKKWARFEREWKKTRRESIHRTLFPFSYREGQKDLAAGVYRTIARGKILFIQAPTGVGKTISTVFPAVKAVGEGLGDKIFYLTAKTSARTVAAEAFSQLRDQGLRMKSVVLTAREKACKCESVQCDPDNCPYAKGHFDRINDAVFELITSEDVFDRERISRAAETYRVCPFELSLDISTWMDAVIGDYNYVFHPRSRLKRFFAEGVKGDYLFLIDEAHNLVDRGRDMYSAELVKEEILEVRREVKEADPALAKGLERVNRRLLELKRECEGSRRLESLGTLPVTLMNLYGTMEEFLARNRSEGNRGLSPAARDKVLDLYFTLGSFLDTCDLLDEHYVIYDEIDSEGRFRLKLLCVNPAANLQECLNKGRSSILFSATLLPVDYYRRLLCTQEDAYAIYASSCFDPSRMQVLIGTDVSSRYTRRSEEEFARTAGYILKMTQARRGNYMAFFSSYRMLESVADAFRAVCPEDIEMIEQTSNMREEDRETFLKAFDAPRSGSLIGFCVMGSIFSEGIDLKQDRLIGAAIVGPGLPMVCTEQELLKTSYEEQGLDGFRFAYQCPGMNRVLQAAGRVIRTEEDAGVVLLLDDRFAQYRYRQMFPREWTRTDRCTLGEVSGKLAAFWEELGEQGNAQPGRGEDGKEKE